MIGIRLHVETVARRARCALCVHTAAGAREVHSIMARSHLMCDEGGRRKNLGNPNEAIAITRA